MNEIIRAIEQEQIRTDLPRRRGNRSAKEKKRKKKKK